MTPADSLAKQLYAPQRHQEILAALEDVGRIEVAQLALDLQVTPETIRRDLTTLERLGLLRRVHGGALPIAQLEDEPSLLDRLGHRREYKERIAKRAIEELPSQGTVLFDSGTTTLAVAKALPKDFSLDVVTNSVAIAALLGDRKGISLHILGGKIRHRTGASVGPWSTRALDALCVDLALLGTNGLTLERGLTTPNLNEATTKRAMVTAARRAIVVSDSSKVGQTRMHRFADLSELAMLITDTELDEETALEFDRAGMEVVRV